MTMQKNGDAFAVYAGDGFYVERVLSAESTVNTAGKRSRLCVRQTMHLGGVEKAAVFARDTAVKACHAVRAAGVNAWVVPHPESFAA